MEHEEEKEEELESDTGNDNLNAKEMLEAKQKKEVKQLRDNVNKKKHSFNKTDKKAKKAAEEEIEKWEKELNEKHKKEWIEFEKMEQLQEKLAVTNIAGPSSSKTTTDDAATEQQGNGTKKPSRQQKRKGKKEEEEAKRRTDAQNEADSMVNYAKEEMIELNKKLDSLDLVIYDIPADGHCLYKAISHQLSINNNNNNNNKSNSANYYYSFSKLRSLAANYMRKNKDEFIMFFSEEDNVDFDQYCNSVENSAEWGGNIELMAISGALQTQIIVYQATIDKPIVIGENEISESPAILLSYHQHMYSLGAHYNSLVKKG